MVDNNVLPFSQNISELNFFAFKDAYMSLIELLI